MSALLTMNFRINSGHTTGGEDMRLSVGKRVIPVFVVVAVLIFSTIGLAHMNRVDSAAEGICPDSHMSYEDVSCKSTGVCRNRRSTYKADQSPYFSGAEQRVSGWQYASAYAVFPVSDLVRLLLLF